MQISDEQRDRVVAALCEATGGQPGQYMAALIGMSAGALLQWAEMTGEDLATAVEQFCGQIKVAVHTLQPRSEGVH